MISVFDLESTAFQPQIQMTAAWIKRRSECTTPFPIQYNYRIMTLSRPHGNGVHQLDETIHYLKKINKSISEPDTSQYVLTWDDKQNLECNKLDEYDSSSIGRVRIHKYIFAYVCSLWISVNVSQGCFVFESECLCWHIQKLSNYKKYIYHTCWWKWNM